MGADLAHKIGKLAAFRVVQNVEKPIQIRGMRDEGALNERLPFRCQMH